MVKNTLLQVAKIIYKSGAATKLSTAIGIFFLLSGAIINDPKLRQALTQPNDSFQFFSSISVLIGIFFFLVAGVLTITKSAKKDKELVTVDIERARSTSSSREEQDVESNIPNQASYSVFARHKGFIPIGPHSVNFDNNTDPYSSHFRVISKTLHDRAIDADKKASILLDRGAMYMKSGIVFFLFSIVMWQVVFVVYGFHTEHYLGIASCSAVFIFIEFISAWFLKQYRHYVDTATYLTKIRLLFDRYQLAYFAAKESGSGEPSQHRIEQLISLLSAEIRWPEATIFTKDSGHFAREAMEAITLLNKELQQKGEGKFGMRRRP